jgi:hypothetical protein
MANNVTVGTALPSKSYARYFPVAARYLLGLIFFVFGLNGFLSFIPAPPLPEPAAAFGLALFKSGYFLPMLKTIEIAAGVALLSNRFVPLALAVLAPIVVNIFAFHFFLGGGIVLPIGLIALELYLAWSYRDVFRPMLRPVTGL